MYSRKIIGRFLFIPPGSTKKWPKSGKFYKKRMKIEGINRKEFPLLKEGVFSAVLAKNLRLRSTPSAPEQYN
jgi:hypothetical protein